MRVTEYLRDFVCRRDVTFCAPIYKKGVFELLVGMPNQGKAVLAWTLDCRFKKLLGFLKKCGGLDGPDKLDGPQ